jgi:hypothetical protein
MYLLSNEVTLEWEIRKTAIAPDLNTLDLVYINPLGEVTYAVSPLLAGNYIPPTETSNGSVTTTFTPELEGLWRIRLVIGTDADYVIKAKMDMFVFDNTTTTPPFVEKPATLVEPFDFEEWVSNYNYNKNAVVKLNDIFYVSTDVNNYANSPADLPGSNPYWTIFKLLTLYNSSTVYSLGSVVFTANGKVWSSVVNGNINYDPVVDRFNDYWEPAFDGNKWYAFEGTPDDNIGILNDFALVDGKYTYKHNGTIWVYQADLTGSPAVAVTVTSSDGNTFRNNIGSAKNLTAKVFIGGVESENYSEHKYVWTAGNQIIYTTIAGVFAGYEPGFQRYLADGTDNTGNPSVNLRIIQITASDVEASLEFSCIISNI